MLRLVQNDDQPRSLTKEMFKELCPSLIYQIDADTCHSSHSNNAHGDHDRFHDHGGHDHGDHDHAVHAESSAIDLSKVPPKGMSCFTFTYKCPLFLPMEILEPSNFEIPLTKLWPRKADR